MATLNNLQRETYSAGMIIFKEGDPGNSAYIIEEGCVEVDVSSTQKALLREGELFGEIALIDQLPRTATVRAVENTVLIPIARALVEELLEAADPVVRHLLLIILERFRSARTQPAFDPTPPTIFKRDTTRDVAAKQLGRAHELTEALTEEQFEMFYQPICDLRSGNLIGFEGLIRWHHPVEGMVSPLEFLGVAELTGQIREIGLWTLGRACLDWPVLRKRINHHKPFVSVNLSPSQLSDEEFVGKVKKIVSERRMSARELKLELTETVIIRNPDRALELLNMLTEFGVILALDDFGTGHSGLYALHRYPIGTMKIDRAFVSQMIETPHCAEIVQASIELAHSLNMDVVAEGIETEVVRQALLKLGCDYGQGWLFGRPVSLGID
jgi:diguanylate cyclase